MRFMKNKRARKELREKCEEYVDSYGKETIL
jgi:hypothetical protein